MLKLFEYNWQVRNEWFNWCEQADEHELTKERTGGMGSILYTLYHIVDVEYSWISGLQGREPQYVQFEDCADVRKLREYAARCRAEIAPFIHGWKDDLETNVLTDQNNEGEWENFSYGEIMRHVIAHEIHHIGQLSIWSREIGKKPVTANLIRRGLFKEEIKAEGKHSL
ncbi:DinB family protein [Paenibacillus montanisoli]|uniref:Damage-inducible protein DinB n=1 Tax=Paenibacillus montanisoli TaxID=2081970 RepID=A0A328TZD8_9BACL|nr:DinB family protein [Paenibacillus montanisoli]RAP75907.1 damage-inducible protein DinB [Paenibacillus montanisoli]